MNWLAHLLLSEPTPEFRLGSILPDLIPTPLLAQLPLEFQGGIRRHRLIDAYTDSHPVVRRSIQRFEPPLRRFGGIVVDVFYDHFLSRDWVSFSDVPLLQFTAAVYATFPPARSYLPSDVNFRLGQMAAYDWLSSYGEVSGVALTLQRISGRLRRPVDLAPAIEVLERNYGSFHADFTAFFPELCSHVGTSSNRDGENRQLPWENGGRRRDP